jgi:RNA polymerase sigma-54 factor
MRPGLQLNLGTQLTLTPQLAQSIRLLQLSSLEFNQEIDALLQSNPLLEREGDLSQEASMSAPAMPGDTFAFVASEPTAQNVAQQVGDELAWGGRETGPARDDDDEFGMELPDRSETSLRQHLIEQVQLLSVPDRQRQLVGLWIDALEGTGYRSLTVAEFVALFDVKAGVTEAEAEAALVLLQTFDPAGVGAADLADCLRLQLLSLPPDTPWRETALTLVQSHLQLLGEREYGKLKKALNLGSGADLAAVRSLISGLDPRPGRQFADVESQYVIPDILVVRRAGRFVAQLNPEAMPRLRVNQFYANLLRSQSDSPGLSAQLQEARFTVKSVQQRFETILRVAQSLTVRQQGWFSEGDAALKPLTLRQIADELELHESTISRVTTQKYMMTPRGLVEFKHFFCSGLSTEDGDAASSLAVKTMIKDVISGEMAARPLSDQAISEALSRRGVKIARRTVAKYREQMHIAPAAERRRKL